jgi:hypothetical protein
LAVQRIRTTDRQSAHAYIRFALLIFRSLATLPEAESSQ